MGQLQSSKTVNDRSSITGWTLDGHIHQGDDELGQVYEDSGVMNIPSSKHWSE